MKKSFQLVLCMMLVLSAMGTSKADAQAVQIVNPEIGRSVDDFTLPSLNSGDISFAALRADKPAIIFFWATWCPHCRSAIKVINEKKEELTANGVEMVIIDVGESEQVVQKFLKRNKLSMDMLLDKDTNVARSFGVMGIPVFIYINKNGVIADIKHSLVDDYARVLNKGIEE